MIQSRENEIELTDDQIEIMAGISQLQATCHQNAVNAGWHSDLETGKPLKRNKLELIALMHSELSEALEGVRKGLKDDKLPNFPMETVELADCVIRIMDYCGLYDLNIADAIIQKIEYNKSRSDHKVENRLKEGGKKF